MRTDKFEKRLNAVEKRDVNFNIICRFLTSAESNAYYLSGGMKSNEPKNGNTLIVNMEWPTPVPITDSLKIRWLRQYTSEKLNEFRQTWLKSTQERDHIALSELDRLLPLVIRHGA